ncbi:MAG: hypothetical protein C0621_05810 [Desulfuromonas sp.]|nr:MAG: hypothetical protein C0621_05810 [Desulfuromonas sp.]
MEIEYKSTFEKHLAAGINLFTGAGFSLLSKDLSGEPLPIGDKLRTELSENFSDIPKILDLPRFCTMVAKTQKDELYKYLYSRFTIGEFSELYGCLDSFEIKNVFTTNIDNLFQKIFETSTKKYVNDANLHGASFRDKQAIDYYYLHGSVLDKESELIFGDLDIASTFSSDPSRWNYLTTLMGRYPTLFWGYALRDAGTLQAFSNALKQHNQKDAWIVVHPDFVEEGEISYYKSIGLKIIKSDTEDLLKYLKSIANDSEMFSEGMGVGKHPFPEYSVPSNSSLKHRAIQDFFVGSTPEWSDIYSPRVIRVRFYDEIEEEINRGKNILITGGPATGKTTLLMQLAAFYDFNGFKFFVKNISKGKAYTFLSAIENKPSMFFIDEIQSSLEALEVLSRIKGARFIFAERDYAYLSSSNSRFLSKSTTVIDVTELNLSDQQKIIENIPADIRSTKTYKKEERDSLYEFIEKNCKTPRIRERFKNVLKDLKSSDQRLVELFLLTCYLHTCRSVASMDVILGYFEKSINDYREIYDLIEMLGSSISECVGELGDESQDYFNIRSNLLADLIYSVSSTSDLAKMLTRFHNNVSRYSIPNFDSFKRRGYDARLFERAYPNTKKGSEIYDIIYKKHPSPFNLQQKALYLSRRRDHQSAFKIIDEAVSRAGSKNWSIKNSYAIIKFKANIDRDNSIDVRRALDESMDALEQCYTADIRKAFHAMTYADHSIRYFNKYRDAKSCDYLRKANEWLTEEQRINQSLGNISRLLRTVNTALSKCE